jgi:hypothetical protein
MFIDKNKEYEDKIKLYDKICLLILGVFSLIFVIMVFIIIIIIFSVSSKDNSNKLNSFSWEHIFGEVHLVNLTESEIVKLFLQRDLKTNFIHKPKYSNDNPNNYNTNNNNNNELFDKKDFIIPSSRKGSCCATYGNTDLTVCFGGEGLKYNSKGVKELYNLNDVWVWFSNKWHFVYSFQEEKYLKTLNFPVGRSFANCWLDNENFYLLGGELLNGTILKDFWSFDVKHSHFDIITYIAQKKKNLEKSWKRLNDFSIPVSRSSCWISKIKDLSFFGGFEENNYTLSNKIWTYKKNQWNLIFGVNGNKTINCYNPKKTYNYPNCKVNHYFWKTKKENEFFIFGGEENDNYTTKFISNDLWQWDGSNWKMIEQKTICLDQSNLGLNYNNFGNETNLLNPGCRAKGVSWFLSTKNELWLWGGKLANDKLKCDLWKYSFNTKSWYWMGGSHIENCQAFIHYDKRILNTPPALTGMSTWIVKNNLHMAFGEDSTGTLYSHLWKYYLSV